MVLGKKIKLQDIAVGRGGRRGRTSRKKCAAWVHIQLVFCLQQILASPFLLRASNLHLISLNIEKKKHVEPPELEKQKKTTGKLNS